MTVLVFLGGAGYLIYFTTVKSLEVSDMLIEVPDRSNDGVDSHCIKNAVIGKCIFVIISPNQLHVTKVEHTLTYACIQVMYTEPKECAHG